MQSNQELMILSLLNLYTSYVNLKKSAEDTDKKPLDTRNSTKQIQFVQTQRKERPLGSKNLGTITKTTFHQKEKTIHRSSAVTSSTSSTNPKNNTVIVAVRADVEKKSPTGDSGAFVVPHIRQTDLYKTETATDKEVELVTRPRIIPEKTKRRKEKDPNRKPRIRRWRVRPTNIDRIKTGYHRKVFTNVKKMEDQQFFEHTRMSKSLFDWLLTFVQSSLRKSKQSILPEERLAMTLNYLAYGTPLQSLAWKHKVGKSTARQIVLSTCDVLWSLLSPIYLSDPTTSQYADIAEEFKSNWYIPNCVGAIDGKNMSVCLPRYKDNSNLLILGACDTKHKFLAVKVGNFNDKSDDGVFQLTSTNDVIISDKLPLPSNKPLSASSPPFPYFFISGTNFPLQKHIMCPYAEINLDEKKSIFNSKISIAHTITENTFGILLARFRVLSTRMEFFPESCKTIILACIVLHNYIMSNDEEQLYCPANFVDRENKSGVIEEGEWRKELQNNGDRPLNSMVSSQNRSTYEAKKLRDMLADFFTTNALSYEI